ncbi:hypothetical protein, partial [Pseudomonas gessardii]|uniref:hypothetical protein n=1 Tax=Pseudomonas gessardii TaxID=78544 RepID=UPI0014746567
ALTKTLILPDLDRGAFFDAEFCIGHGGTLPEGEVLHSVFAAAMNKDTTPMLVWRNGKLVKNPEYAIERSNAQESRQNVPPTSDGSKQDE